MTALNAIEGRSSLKLDQKRVVPIREHVREFQMADGRPIHIDRRVIAFVCQSKDDPQHTIIAFKLAGARPVPVVSDCAGVASWWLDCPGATARSS